MDITYLIQQKEERGPVEPSGGLEGLVEMYVRI